MNIPATKAARELLGIVTQDGMFRAVVMMFGLCNAPYFFQYIMDTLKTRAEK